MNVRTCQYPNCFAWTGHYDTFQLCPRNNLPDIDITPLSQVLANSEFKCIYDKNKNDTAEIYVFCYVLEMAFHLGVNLMETAMDVKKRINHLKKIPTCLLHLFFRGVALRNEELLLNCGVTHKSVLLLGIKLHTAQCNACKIPSYIQGKKPVLLKLDTLNGDTLEATIPLASPVEALKQYLDNKYNIYPDHQLIMHEQRKLEDDVILEEYGVTDNSKLIFMTYQFDNCMFCYGCSKEAQKATISLKFLSNYIPCIYEPQWTVKKLKDVSYQYLYHIHPDLQRLRYNGQELSDEVTLESHGIPAKATLDVELRFDQRKCDECGANLI